MPLTKPPLWDEHADRGAKFTEFGGWDMPVEFDSIRAEHAAVRESVGIFDVSHMGELTVAGPDASTVLQRLTTNDVTALDVGDAQYAAITDEGGVVVDDTVIYRLPDEDGDPAYLFVPNAGTDEAAFDRVVSHRNEWGLEATVDNRTDEFAMFAVQGPDAVAAVRGAVDDPDPVIDLSRFSVRYADVAGVECLVSRTGYTGEDGFEFVVPWREAETVWRAFVAPDAEPTAGEPGPDAETDTEGGADVDGKTADAKDADAITDAADEGARPDGDDDTVTCRPCGLGARDTLRIEAGFVLAGQDFDAESDPRTPYEAGIGFVVDLDTEFVGRDALAEIADEGVEERLVGFTLIDRGVPRHGYDVTNAENRVIGTVTSGTMSPTLERPIGLAYVPVEYADPGTTLRVVVRGQSKKARVETTPFVDTIQ